MLDALLSDLAVIRRPSDRDHRGPPVLAGRPPGVEVVTLSPSGNTPTSRLPHRVGRRRLADGAGDRPGAWSAWRRGWRRSGRCSSGPERPRSAGRPTRRASRGALARHGVAHPEARAPPGAGPWGWPRVSSAIRSSSSRSRGAGCEGVWLARNARELGHAVDMARRAGDGGATAASALRAGGGRERFASGRRPTRRGAEREQPGGPRIAPASLPRGDDAARPSSRAT